ncbi:hypothetical protein [Alcanivorax sp. 1008]|uniref:hypothetical protein n=1 Tax=Alcanivorax sp. 1008 TaxID=2816853 RepID=UPI001DE763C0|nr:hypothetical protein [Alcanivorax sp. 1008]MCC1496584.1 hypothetical protein [Alcanivorax sp. 1008]
MSNVIKLGSKSPQRAVEALNRMTGLVFDHWPESLIGLTPQDEPERQHDKGTVLKLARRSASV